MTSPLPSNCKVTNPVVKDTALMTSACGMVGEGKSLYVFGICFTKFLKIKHFTTFFIKDFIVNGKYFTSLTIIYLQTNTSKWKKEISKFFFSKQTAH